MKLIFGKGKVSNIIAEKSDVVLSRSECDVSSMDNIRESLDRFEPDIVVNCAAKTNLEYCQDNKHIAYESNVCGAINLLRCSQEREIKLVHISSGCLFDGNHSIADENTKCSPAVWYTWTKLWADEYILNSGYKNFLILRPRQLISKTPHPTNLITKFMSLDYIPAIDEPNSVTCIEDFKEMIDHLLKVGATGIFNCSNTGAISPHEIAMGIQEILKPSLFIKKISYEKLLEILPNKRVNTLLSCNKLINTGYTPRSAREALRWCLVNYGI